MLLVMGTIFFLSSRPVPENIPSLFPHSDKCMHMVAYGVLAATVIFAAGKKMRKKYSLCVAFAAIGISLTYGLTDELHQSFVPTRDVDIFDVVADIAGAAITSAFWFCLNFSKRNG
jgi:VanZ family protein